MAVEKSYARLGFFIVLTLVLFLVTAVFFIQRLKKRPAIGMVAYTTDNVFGLDISSQRSSQRRASGPRHRHTCEPTRHDRPNRLLDVH
jgi:hypothetical protein